MPAGREPGEAETTSVAGLLELAPPVVGFTLSQVAGDAGSTDAVNARTPVPEFETVSCVNALVPPTARLKLIGELDTFRTAVLTAFMLTVTGITS